MANRTSEKQVRPSPRGVETHHRISTGGASSIRDLARASNKSHAAVRKWLADDRWPFTRTPPWSAATVQKIIAWAAATLAPDPAAAPPTTDAAELQGRAIERQVKLKRLLAQAKLTEAQLRILEGEWMPREEVERTWTAQVTAVNAALFAMVNTLHFIQTLRQAQSDGAACDLLRDRLVYICKCFADGKTP